MSISKNTIHTNISSHVGPVFQILLAPTLELARQAVNENYISATVEAEYGDICIEGTIATLAHHGSRSQNPAPCNTPDVPVLDGGIILISHLDLDAIGGILKLMGKQANAPEFWKSAEHIDVHGMHHIHELSSDVQNQLNAFLAWQNSIPRTNYSELTDVTDFVEKARIQLEIILTPSHLDHSTAIEAGIAWKKNSTMEIEKRLVYEDEYVRAFKTDGIFCGAAYYSPKQDKIIPSTVSLNTVTHAITVAFADGGLEHDAKDLVVELWGSTAGGRSGIAGSPRNWNISDEEATTKFQKCIEKTKELYIK